MKINYEKYSIYNLKEDDGKSEKSPFIQMITELSQNKEIPDKIKIDIFFKIAVELNLQLKDFKQGYEGACIELDRIYKKK